MKISLIGFGDRDGDAVGIDAIRFAVAVETEWRDDGHDALREERVEQFGVHALDLAGELMIHAADDAHRVRDDDVRAGGAEVVGRKTFENLVRQPVRGGERELERVRVRDARPVEVGSGNFLFVRKRFDLRGCAVDEHNTDVERAQHGDIEQQRGEIFVGDDRAVDREDERLLAKLRNVLQDAPQVGQFHFRTKEVIGFARDSNNNFINEEIFSCRMSRLVRPRSIQTCVAN
jgi:hypothetical protein